MIRRRLIPVLTFAALCLVFPATAFAITINEEYKPQEEFKLYPWIDLGPFSIDKFTFYLVLGCAVTIGIMLYVARKMEQRPNRIQTAIEAAYVFMRDQLVRENIENRGVARRWFPFIATLFLFLWFANMIGYIPLPTNTHETMNIFGLELPTFALYAITAVSYTHLTLPTNSRV